MSEPTITPEQIAAWQRARAERAAVAINAALAVEDCELVALPQLTADGRIVAVVQIRAR